MCAAQASSAQRPALAGLFLFGAFSSAAQLLLMRQLMIIAHGEELIIGAFLGCYLLWAAAGSWAGARYLVKSRAPRISLAVLMLTAGVGLVLTLAAVGQVNTLLGRPPVEQLPPGRLLAFIAPIMAPFCLAVGATFPLAVSALARGTGLKQPVGRVFGWEALGSGPGTLAIYLLLFPSWQPMNLAFLLGGLSALAAWLMAASPGGESARRWVRAAALLTLLLMVAAASSERLHQAYKQAQWQGSHFIAGRASREGYMEAVGLQGQVSVYLNGNLAATSGGQGGARRLTAIARLQRPSARRLLLLGASLGGHLSQLRDLGTLRCDSVGSEADLRAFALAHMGARLRATAAPCRHLDQEIRAFVRGAAERYDLILLGVPLPSTVAANRFYTAEFYRELRLLLAPGGVVLLEVESSPRFISPPHLRLLATLRRTLATAFPSVTLLPGNQCILLASDDPAFKLNEGDPSTPAQALHYRRLFGQDNALTRDRLEEIVSAAPAGPINRDLKPVGYLQHLAQTLHEHQSPLAGPVERLIALRGELLFAIPLLLGLLLLLRRESHRSRRLLAGTAAALAGVSGTSSLLILMYAVQLTAGDLFHQLGLLTTTFMLGAALGSLLVSRLGSRGEVLSARLFLGASLGLTLLPLLILALLLLGPVPAPVLALAALLSGGAPGVLFPRAAALWAGGARAHSAGRIYALDLVGASLGAALIGPLLLATVGAGGACAWLAALNLACLLAALRQLAAVARGRAA